MALHARELAKCATTALARQMQICARRKPLNAGTPSYTSRLVPVRGINNTSSLGSAVGNGGGPVKGSNPVQKGGNNKIVEDDPAKIRRPIKFATQERVLAKRRFLPEYARATSRRAATEPLTKNGQSIRQKSNMANKDGTAPTRKSNKVKLNPIAAEVTRNGSNKIKEEPEQRHHRKEMTSSDKRKTVKYQKKSNQLEKSVLNAEQISLTKPVTKLAKDINEWFNEVVDHLAKADNAPSNSKPKNVSSPQASRSTKATGVSSSNKHERSKMSNSEVKYIRPFTPKTDGSAWGNAIKESGKPVVMPWKPKSLKSWDLDSPLASNSSKINLDQIEKAVMKLNADLDRSNGRIGNVRKSVDQSGLTNEGRGKLGYPEKPKPIMEIRPSLVENSEALIKRGTPVDPRKEIPALRVVRTNSSSRRNNSKPNYAQSKSTGAAAVVTSNLVSGSSKHKLIGDAVKGRSTSNILLSPSKPLDTGKGFILLNNTEKTKEAKEKAMRKNQPASDTPSKNINSSFILVESNENQLTKSTRNNRLLTDNPHAAALTRNKAIFSSGPGNAREDNTVSRVRKSPIMDKDIYVESARWSKAKSGSAAAAADFDTTDQYARRWVEKVERKLSEIAAAKQAAQKQTRGIEKRFVSAQSSISQGNSLTKNNTIENQNQLKANGLFKSNNPSSDASTSLFGPLTKEQHKLLQNMRSIEKSSNDLKTNGDRFNNSHLYFNGKSQTKPVTIGELKPDVKDMKRKDQKERNVTKQKSEPKLYVKPEELVSSKGIKVSKSTTSMDTPTTKPVMTNETEPPYSEYELWSKLLGVGASAKPSQTHKLPAISTKPNVSGKVSASSSEKRMKDTSNKSNTDNILSNIKRSSSNLIRSDAQYKLFQEQFLKQQHEKLIRSQNLKVESNAIGKDKKISIAKNAHQNASLVPVIKEKTKTSKTEPLPRNQLTPSAMPSKENKRAGSKKDVSSDIDPFEAWMVQMEDIGSMKPVTSPIKKDNSTKKANKKSINSHQLNSHAKSAEKDITASQNDLQKITPKKVYPRFESKISPEVAQSISNDIIVSHACLTSDCKQRKVSRENTVPSPHNVYQQIKNGTGKTNAIPLNGLVPNKSSRLEDPANLQKIGKLFRSLDGFVAMNAVRVLDEPSLIKVESSTPRVNDTKTPKPNVELTQVDTPRASGDGLSAENMRKSLAKEREDAVTDARRRMIEAYEKNIEKYEKSLENNRNKLRQARQTMLDSQPLKPKRSPSNDNPRRH